MVVIVLSSLGGLLAVSVVAILLASGIFAKQAYLEPWKMTYAQKFDDPRIQLAAHGILAANGHNMQPWKIRLDADSRVFYLYADPERLTPEVDPYARQFMITQGTFLEYVKVAGAKLGYKTEISLFPLGEYDEGLLVQSMKEKPVAKVVLSKAVTKDDTLYNEMFLPDTNRAAYKEEPLTASAIAQLRSINQEDDRTITFFQGADELKRLGTFALEGTKIEADVHRINEEAAGIFRFNEYQKNKYRYGFSFEGQGTIGMKKHLLQGLVTLLPFMNNEKSSAGLMIKTAQTGVNHTPAYAMILTQGNSRTQQVTSGMLYSRLILTAHTLGYVMQPLSQPIEEYSEMKELYEGIHREFAPKGETIQMFVRLGKPTKEFPLTMRRDVNEMIMK
ncbi:Acg family FMN-binding oxidoreductase [Gorillibacterium massiliense]|uniref:Acg family FMN-binding oxidoreductase n=1 Tax=Gorillibacterium massiliense TaxID=1280390 RepID=UPI001EE160DC|nr:hypothetical protein [Gorillibacterium massiliense]